MKTIAYLRVSKDQLDLENQRTEIERFCKYKKFRVDQWIEEVITGTKDIRDKQVWKTIETLSKGDILIMTEISRAGRDMWHMSRFTEHCFNNDISLYFTRLDIAIKNNALSKFMVSALAFAAEAERESISERTKEALKRKKQEGVVLGRKKGSKMEHRKLDPYQGAIRKYLLQGISKSKISRVIGCNRLTLDLYIKDRILITAKN